MNFHFPSFKHYLLMKFDDSFNVYFHNLYLYLIPPNAYFSKALLCEFVTEALIESIEAPLRPPTGPQQRSLFEAPPVPHCEALTEALSLSWQYMVNTRLFEHERGERIEYAVNLRVLRGILQDVRLSEDVKRTERLIQDDFFISERGLVIKGLRHDGRDIGKHRARRVVRVLEELGYYGKNGNLRTLGREVLKWPKP